MSPDEMQKKVQELVSLYVIKKDLTVDEDRLLDLLVEIWLSLPRDYSREAFGDILEGLGKVTNKSF